jgi:hypothetical protein
LEVAHGARALGVGDGAPPRLQPGEPLHVAVDVLLSLGPLAESAICVDSARVDGFTGSPPGRRVHRMLANSEAQQSAPKSAQKRPCQSVSIG